MTTHAPTEPTTGELTLASRTFTSRLIVGTGKYENERRHAPRHRGLRRPGRHRRRPPRAPRQRPKDAPSSTPSTSTRSPILPNTAGCFDPEDAVRVARLGRDLLEQLGNPGASWVKLEVLGDKKTLLPDPVGTLEATRELVKDGFDVLAYTSDDPIAARRLKDAGAASVMPAGSPIGSGQGILNPAGIALCLELLKEDDPAYPVVVDAGVGAASDTAVAMELGADGVLCNTAIAHARDPVAMAAAMKRAVEAGSLSYRAGRIPKKKYATASSPGRASSATSPGPE